MDNVRAMEIPQWWRWSDQPGRENAVRVFVVDDGRDVAQEVGRFLHEAICLTRLEAAALAYALACGLRADLDEPSDNIDACRELHTHWRWDPEEWLSVRNLWERSSFGRVRDLPALSPPGYTVGYREYVVRYRAPLEDCVALAATAIEHKMLGSLTAILLTRVLELRTPERARLSDPWLYPFMRWAMDRLRATHPAYRQAHA